MTWSLKLPRYSIVKRQKNKVKGYEVTYSCVNHLEPEFLGFMGSISECKEIIIIHAHNMNFKEFLFNGQVTKLENNKLKY